MRCESCGIRELTPAEADRSLDNPLQKMWCDRCFELRSSTFNYRAEILGASVWAFLDEMVLAPRLKRLLDWLERKLERVGRGFRWLGSGW